MLPYFQTLKSTVYIVIFQKIYTSSKKAEDSLFFSLLSYFSAYFLLFSRPRKILSVLPTKLSTKKNLQYLSIPLIFNLHQ